MTNILNYLSRNFKSLTDFVHFAIRAKTKIPHTSPKSALKTILVWIAFKAKILFFTPIA